MNATTLNRRQAMTAVAGAAFLTGGASCTLGPAIAGQDPFLDALAAYMAIGPELTAADEAAAQARGAAMDAYPERPFYPLYVGKDGERQVFPGDVDEKGEPYRFTHLPETVAQLWEVRDHGHAERGLIFKEGKWVKAPPRTPEFIARSNKKYEARARQIEAWQAERARVNAACGVPEADARLDAVEERLDALYTAMTNTRATTAAGILARLEFFRDEQQGNGECCPDTLDAIIGDVRRMAGGVA